MRRNIARMCEAFPEVWIELLQLVAEGERVFAGIQPTVRTVRFVEAGFFQVRDAVVVAADYVADGLGARIQLGVLPEDNRTNSQRLAP